jgi:hypothetical protein
MTTRNGWTPGSRDDHTLGFYLYRSSFPGDRGRLIADARRAGAPDVLVTLLSRLPAPPAEFADLAALEVQLEYLAPEGTR